jgi:hypothetical protein
MQQGKGREGKGREGKGSATNRFGKSTITWRQPQWAIPRRPSFNAAANSAHHNKWVSLSLYAANKQTKDRREAAKRKNDSKIIKLFLMCNDVIYRLYTNKMYYKKLLHLLTGNVEPQKFFNCWFEISFGIDWGYSCYHAFIRLYNSQFLQIGW